jgi:hypothetical protein
MKASHAAIIDCPAPLSIKDTIEKCAAEPAEKALLEA